MKSSIYVGIIIALLLITIPFIMGGGYTEYLTKGFADTLYCALDKECTLNKLTVYNLSVIGQVFNVTMNLVTWNITENFNVGGNLIASNITASYFIGNGSKLTSLNETDSLAYNGTLAYNSNLSNYVPYTGATTDVDLGANQFITTGYGGGLYSIWDDSWAGFIGMEMSGSNEPRITYAGNDLVISTETGGVVFQIDSSYNIRMGGNWIFKQGAYLGNLSGGTITASRTWTFPDDSGTLALSKSVIPYTGATSDVDLGSYDLNTTGNITASYFIGNGSLLTNIGNSSIDLWNWYSGMGYYTDANITASEIYTLTPHTNKTYTGSANISLDGDVISINKSLKDETGGWTNTSTQTSTSLATNQTGNWTMCGSGICFHTDIINSTTVKMYIG